MHTILNSLQAKLLATVVALLATIAGALGIMAQHAKLQEQRQLAREQETIRFARAVRQAEQRAPKVTMSAARNW